MSSVVISRSEQHRELPFLPPPSEASSAPSPRAARQDRNESPKSKTFPPRPVCGHLPKARSPRRPPSPLTSGVQPEQRQQGQARRPAPLLPPAHGSDRRSRPPPRRAPFPSRSCPSQLRQAAGQGWRRARREGARQAGLPPRGLATTGHWGQRRQRGAVRPPPWVSGELPPGEGLVGSPCPGRSPAPQGSQSRPVKLLQAFAHQTFPLPRKRPHQRARELLPCHRQKLLASRR